MTRRHPLDSSGLLRLEDEPDYSPDDEDDEPPYGDDDDDEYAEDDEDDDEDDEEVWQVSRHPAAVPTFA